VKLEEELNLATPFANQRQKAMLNLAYTYGVLLERTLGVLSAFDLNDQHYNILKTLNEHYPEPLPVGEIKRLLLSKRGDLTRLLDKLSAMGLVVRDVDPEDRRVVLVTMSEKGRQQVAIMDAQLDEQRDATLNLSEQEAEQLNILLDKLRG
jgi:DNA-binding MarR family transcriptional regulator